MRQTCTRCSTSTGNTLTLLKTPTKRCVLVGVCARVCVWFVLFVGVCVYACCLDVCVCVWVLSVCLCVCVLCACLCVCLRCPPSYDAPLTAPRNRQAIVGLGDGTDGLGLGLNVVNNIIQSMGGSLKFSLQRKVCVVSRPHCKYELVNFGRRVGEFSHTDTCDAGNHLPSIPPA